MTAYGRAQLTNSWGRISLEIASVNRKHLEINIFLPQELSRFDPHLRKILNESIHRGQVTVKVFAYFEKATPVTVTPNMALARQLNKAWETIAKELGMPKQDLNLSLLAQEKGIILYEETTENEQTYLSTLTEALQQALQPFLMMRELEGSTLQKEIAQRLQLLKNFIDQVEFLAPQATEKYRQKLSSRLEGLFPNLTDNEDKLLREVALFAERSDITEEITRFKSHLDQASKLIQSKEPIGKTLEFLLQEMQREVNTTGAKAADVGISRLVVDMKSELEKIREQIQNVE